jgi:hypothetical protein
MPRKVPIKVVANAMITGLKLSYRGKLQRNQRQLLYELLDDMAVGLTKEGVEEDNRIFRMYAGVLGALCDEISLPLDSRKWPNHRRSKR